MSTRPKNPSMRRYRPASFLSRNQKFSLDQALLYSRIAIKLFCIKEKALSTFIGRRVVFAAKGEVRLDSWEMDSPAPGEVVLKNVASLISAGTELSRLYDYHMSPRPFPQNTGYVCTARVAAAGDGVENVAVGDLVDGSFGHLEYIRKPAAGLLKIPDGVLPEHAAFTALAAISLRAIRQAHVRLGDSVFVTGLGLIGQFAQLFARLSGGNPVAGVDLSTTRLEIARKTGLRHALNGSDSDFEEQLKGIVPDGRFGVCVDSTGTPNVIASLPARASSFGNVVILGGVHKKVELDFYTDVQKKSLHLIGAGSPDPRDYPYDEANNRATILNLMRDGLLDVSPLITHKVPVEEAPEMYRMLHDEKDKGMGVIFDWEKSC